MSWDMKQRDEIETSLNQILSSPGFENSVQMQNFLRFIVQMTLDGKASDIKGYTIGIDALGKSEDFDPTTDPSVRVLAGRLRQSLTTFYAENNEPSGPRIELPKGGYVPKFSWPEKTTPSPQPDITPAHATPPQQVDNPPSAQPVQKEKLSKPLIASIALGCLALMLGAYSVYISTLGFQQSQPIPEPRKLYAEHTKLPAIALEISLDKNGLPEWISPELARSRAIVAFSRFNEYRIIPAAEAARNETAVDYRINLFLSKSPESENMDMFTIIRQQNTQEVIWSERVAFSEPESEIDRPNRNKVADLVSSIMSPYGIIYGDIINRPYPPPRLNCIRNIYDYFNSEDLQAYSNGYACANEVIQSGSASSSMHAMLSFLLVEAHRRQLKNLSKNALAQAREQADLAIRKDEGNARAYQARFAVEKTSGNRTAAMEIAQEAIKKNPFDRDIIGDFAAYLVSINQLEEAREHLTRALELTPQPPAWLTFYQYLHADLTGDRVQANALAKTIEPSKSPLLAVALILAAERTGNHKRMKEAADALKETQRTFLDSPEKAFLRRGFDEELASQLAKRVNTASEKIRLAALPAID